MRLAPSWELERETWAHGGAGQLCSVPPSGLCPWLLWEVRAELSVQHCSERWALRLSPRDPWWWDFAVTSSTLSLVSAPCSLLCHVWGLHISAAAVNQSLNPALATCCGLLVALNLEKVALISYLSKDQRMRLCSGCSFSSQCSAQIQRQRLVPEQV